MFQVLFQPLQLIKMLTKTVKVNDYNDAELPPSKSVIFEKT